MPTYYRGSCVCLPFCIPNSFTLTVITKCVWVDPGVGSRVRALKPSLLGALDGGSPMSPVDFKK